MQVMNTHPGTIYGRSYFDLSEEEKERLQEILNELRDIFNADSVGLVNPEVTIGPKCDYTIRIYNGDTIGHCLD